MGKKLKLGNMQKIHFKFFIVILFAISQFNCSTTKVEIYRSNKSLFNEVSSLLLENYLTILETYECYRNFDSETIIIKNASDSCIGNFNSQNPNALTEIFYSTNLQSISLSPSKVHFIFESSKSISATTSYSLLFSSNKKDITRYLEDKDFTITNIDTNWYYITMNYHE